MPSRLLVSMLLENMLNPIQPRVSLTAQGHVFAGNDTLRFRGVNLGLEGICFIAPFQRASGQFVRVQVTLEPGLMLDSDGILEECVRHGGEWRWAVRFSGLDSAQTRVLDGFVERQRGALAAERALRKPPGGPSAATQAKAQTAAREPSAPGQAKPAPPREPSSPVAAKAAAPRAAGAPPATPPPAAPKQTGVRLREDAVPAAGNRALKDLFKEALDEVGVRKR